MLANVVMFSFSSADPNSIGQEVDGLKVAVVVVEVGIAAAAAAAAVVVVVVVLVHFEKPVVFLSFHGNLNGVMEVMFNSGRMSSALRVLVHSDTLAGRLSLRPNLGGKSFLPDRSGKLNGRLSRRCGRRCDGPTNDIGDPSGTSDSSLSSCGGHAHSTGDDGRQDFQQGPGVGSDLATLATAAAAAAAAAAATAAGSEEAQIPDRPGGSDALRRLMFSTPDSRMPSSDQ